MGWSCSQLASRRMEAVSAACIASTGSQNVIEVAQKSRLKPPTQKYMIEMSRREHADGAITGKIWKFVGENCISPQSFRINGDGTIETGPKWMKDIPFKVLDVDGTQSLWRGTADLHTYIKGDYIKQFMPGGVNAHISPVPYPRKAAITNENGELVETWKAAMFEVW